MWMLLGSALAYCVDPPDHVVWADEPARLKFQDGEAPPSDPWWSWRELGPWSGGHVWAGTYIHDYRDTPVDNPRERMHLVQMLRRFPDPALLAPRASPAWWAEPPGATQLSGLTTPKPFTCWTCSCSGGVYVDRIEGAPRPPAFFATFSTTESADPATTWSSWTRSTLVGAPNCLPNSLDWQEHERVWVSYQRANIRGELGPRSEPVRVDRPDEAFMMLWRESLSPE